MLSISPEHHPGQMKYVSVRLFHHRSDGENALHYIDEAASTQTENAGYLVAAFSLGRPYLVENERRPISDIINLDNLNPVINQSLVLAGVCYEEDFTMRDILQDLDEVGLPSPLTHAQVLQAVRQPAYFSVNQTGSTLSLENLVIKGRGLNLLADIIPSRQQLLNKIPDGVNRDLITYTL